jgi:hypothetical protein
MVRRVAATLLVVAAGVGASELRDRLDAALRLEDPRAAAAGLRRALEAAPSGDHVAESIAPAHWRVIDALASGPRTIDVAKRLVRLAYPREPARVPALPPAEELAKEVVFGDTYGKRFDASVRLRALYGERATPHLVEYLDEGMDERIHAHVAIICRLGRDALLPLCAAASTRNDVVLESVVAELGCLADIRSLPVLLEIQAAEATGPLPTGVARAVAKVRDANPGLANMSAEAAYVEIGRRYFAGHPSVALFPKGQPTLVWTQEAGALTPREVPRHLYLIELGKGAVQDALRLNPRNEQALAHFRAFRESERLAERLVPALVGDG